MWTGSKALTSSRLRPNYHSSRRLRRGLTQALALMKRGHLLFGAVAAAAVGTLFWFNSIYGWQSTIRPER